MPRRKLGGPHADLLKANRHRYEALLEAQGGHCALCLRTPSLQRRLDLDHDHHRMVIRGLLCHRCNRALVAWISKEWLLKAAAYVNTTAKEN